MEETISLSEIFEVLKKRFKIILASTVIITLLVAIISLFFIRPKYGATSQIIVNEPNDDKQDEIDINNKPTNVVMNNSYNVIITSPAVIDEVVDELKLAYGA